MSAGSHERGGADAPPGVRAEGGPERGGADALGPAPEGGPPGGAFQHGEQDRLLPAEL